MITTFTDIQHISSSSPNRFKRRLSESWDGANCGFLTDSEPTVIKNSDTDRPVELITCVDTGQHQSNLPLLCPSPQAGRTRTRAMASMKRRPSPTEDREPEQQSRKRRPQSESENPADDEADSAEGSNSLDSTQSTNDHPATVDSILTSTDHPAAEDSTQTTNDHPATVDSILTNIDHPASVDFTQNTNDNPAAVDRMETEPPGLKPLKMPCENWSRAKFIDYCFDTDSVFYPDLSIKKLSTLLFLQTINYIAFTTLTDDHFDSDTKNIIFKQHTKMLESKDKKTKVKMKNQSAFFFFRRKDGSFTKPFGPYFPKDKGKVHSEDLVCAEIQKLGKGLTEYSDLYIYTVNSPCMGRKNIESESEPQPCMIRLICLSDMLGRHYGIKTYITFSKHYGSTGPICKCLPDHTYRKCSFSSKSIDSTYIKNISEPSENLNNKDKDPQSKFLMKKSSRYKKAYLFGVMLSNESNTSIIKAKNDYDHNGFSSQHSYNLQTKIIDGDQDLVLNMNTVAEYEDRESKFLMKKSSRYKKTNSSLAFTPNEADIQMEIQDNSKFFLLQRTLEQQTYDQELELARNLLIREPDQQSRFLMKISSRFKKNKLIYLVKENIPRDLWNVLFQQINSFNPVSPESPHTFEEFEKKGMETSEEFEKLLRALISEEDHQSVCNSICDTFKSEFLNWWATNLEQSFSTFLNERLSEGINREATRCFIHNIQNLPYRPIIGCIGDITDPGMCCSDAVTPSPDNPLK